MKEFDFKPGDIVKFCDEEFVVLKNYGNIGMVQENYKDGAIVNYVCWNYQGEKFILVKDGVDKRNQ